MPPLKHNPKLARYNKLVAAQGREVAQETMKREWVEEARQELKEERQYVVDTFMRPYNLLKSGGELIVGVGIIYVLSKNENLFTNKKNMLFKKNK